MAVTKVSDDQLRFSSAATGDHDLGDYLEDAEKGGYTLGEILDFLVDEDTGIPKVLVWEGEWQASTLYAIGDVVRNGYVYYTCKLDHTSGLSFSATNWEEIYDFTEVVEDAQDAATAAAGSAVSAQASLESFLSKYLGASASDPTVDGNGDPVTVGDLYFNTGSGLLKIYNGTVWQNIATFSDPLSVGSLAVTSSVTFSGATVTQIGSVLGGTINNVVIGGVTPAAGTFTTVSDQYGNIRRVPQSGSAKTSSYQLATTDNGRFIEVGSGGSITVPDATFSTGDIVTIFNNTSGNVTLTMSITTAYIAGSDSDKATITLATRGTATILFISGTVCVVNGAVS